MMTAYKHGLFGHGKLDRTWSIGGYVWDWGHLLWDQSLLLKTGRGSCLKETLRIVRGSIEKGRNIFEIDDAWGISENALRSATHTVSELLDCFAEFPGRRRAPAMKEWLHATTGQLHIDVWIIETLLRLLLHQIQSAAVRALVPTFPSVHVDNMMMATTSLPVSRWNGHGHVQIAHCSHILPTTEKKDI